MDKKLIFISCGQQTDEEKALGKSVKDVVDSKPGFEGYFAEYVQSLEGLSSNIFDALRRCSGFIAFLHDRGRVIGTNDTEWGVRSSVWVNQEIAILAYRQFVEAIQIPVLVFKEENVVVEGAMTSLIANPIAIGSREAVLGRVRNWLSSNKFPAPVGPSDDAFERLWDEIPEDGRKVVRAILDLSGTGATPHSIQTRIMDLYRYDLPAAQNLMIQLEQKIVPTGLIQCERIPNYGRRYSVSEPWRWHILRALNREG